MKLWRRITPTPNTAIATVGSQMSPARRTMHQPSIQMTPARRYSPKSNVEGPGEANDGELQQHQHEAAGGEVPRQLGPIAKALAEQVRGRPGKERERGRDEVGDPASEENAGVRPASGDSGVDAHVIDGHEDHRHAARYVDRVDAPTGFDRHAGQCTRKTKETATNDYLVSCRRPVHWLHGCGEPAALAGSATAHQVVIVVVQSGAMRRGSERVNVDPSSNLLSAVSSAPMARARSRLIERPSPVPTTSTVCPRAS